VGSRLAAKYPLPAIEFIDVNESGAEPGGYLLYPMPVNWSVYDDGAEATIKSFSDYFKKYYEAMCAGSTEQNPKPPKAPKGLQVCFPKNWMRQAWIFRADVLKDTCAYFYKLEHEEDRSFEYGFETGHRASEAAFEAFVDS
jgi:hypothetical protein